MSQNHNNSQRGGGNTQRGNVLGTAAGTGFRSMAAAIARTQKRRGRGGDHSDDEYFENPNRGSQNNRNNRNNNNNNNRRNNSRGTAATAGRGSNAGGSVKGGRTNNNFSSNRSALSRGSSRHSRSNLSSSMASSHRSSSSGSYYSSDDSDPTHGSGAARNSRHSVHSRSTAYSRQSYATRSSVSGGYSDGDSYSSDDDDDSSYAGSAYSRATRSSLRSGSRSHMTATTGADGKSTVATGTLRGDGRSAAGRSANNNGAMASAGSNYLSSRRSRSSAGAHSSQRRRERSSAAGGSSDHAHSYGAGSSSDSGGSSSSDDGHRERSRSNSPLRRARQQKLAIAAVLDSTAAGGFECLLEDPARQPTARRTARGGKANGKQSFRRVASKSVDRGSSVDPSEAGATGTSASGAGTSRRAIAADGDDGDETMSRKDRKEHAAEYRLNLPILQRFCTEFSTPFSFATTDGDNGASGASAVPVAVDEHTGVPLNTQNQMNAPLMAAVRRAVSFVLLQAPQYPSEMVRALLWRIVQSSAGPHDRLGAWKLLDGVLRCLHRRLAAHNKNGQALKARESTIQQDRHAYEQAKTAAAATGTDDANAADTVEEDRLFFADIAAALSLIDKERLEARAAIRWVKTMLGEIAQLLPYLILYCWGGDKSAAFKAGGSSSKAAAKRLSQIQREAEAARNGGGVGGSAPISSSTNGASSALATASDASDGGRNAVAEAALAADLDIVKRKVMDFVAGRLHGDGTMTERGQQHHATLLRHHHSLESLAAATAQKRNTITTQSRFAVGNGMHLTTSMAKQVLTERALASMNAQIFAEYDAMLRGWNALFASGQYYVSYAHLRRAVGDYAALLSDHDSAMGLRMGANKSLSKHREGSDLYHFALKASHLKNNGAAAPGERSVSQHHFIDGIYHRQREVFEAFLLPPARMVDSLWRFRRAEPRPSLVATVLSLYGWSIFKTGFEEEDSSAAAAASSSKADETDKADVYDPVAGAAARRIVKKGGPTRPEDSVEFCYPRSAAEVADALGFELNDRFAAWIRKAAEHCGGCLACDSWTHNFNTCPYRPSRFAAQNRRIVAALTAAEAIDLLKSTASRTYSDRSVATATLAALAGGGVSADRAGSDATGTNAGSPGVGLSAEQQGAARKQLVLDVLDTAAERCAGGVEMDSVLNALDVILRQTSSGRERQAIAVLASYRLQPSRMLQFTNAASNSVAPISRRSGRRKQNLVDYGRPGRTPAAEKLLAYLTQEKRIYESGRLRAAMETLYFRYLCIPHSDAVMVQQLQRDTALIRENRCFVDVLTDDEAPLQSRIFAVAPKSVLAAAIARVKRMAHLLDPCTLELSPCCAGAAVDAVRAFNSQQGGGGGRDPLEATEPWDWYVARQVLKSERLVSQHDGLSATIDDFASRIQHSSELIERLEDRAAYLDRRTDGRVAASRLRLVSFLVGQCGYCTSCNRFGHGRKECAELAATLIRATLSAEARRELGINSLTSARIAAPSIALYIRALQASRHRARDDRRVEIDRDVRTLTELVGLLGATPADGAAGGPRERGPNNAGGIRSIPPAVALVARRVGGVRSGQIDLGSTATCRALPPAIGAAIKAITQQTGLTLAEVRFCPDEALALFHAASHHHLTPHVAAFRSRRFPALLITTSQFEDDAFDERSALDRIAGANMTADLSSQTLAQLSNPSARRRHRAYALPAEQFTGIALGFDGTGRLAPLSAGGVLTEGLLRALNSQQLCRDRYLDLAAYLMRTSGSGSVDAEGVADYETVYSLFFPTSAEARAARSVLLARGQALHDELFRRVAARVPTLNPNAPVTHRPYGVVYELERDYFLRNLTVEGDKASYTFFAAVQCRSNMAARLRRYTQERMVPLPKSVTASSSQQQQTQGGASSSASSAHLSVPNSQHLHGMMPATPGALPPHMLTPAGAPAGAQPMGGSSYATVTAAIPPPMMMPPPPAMLMPGGVAPPPLPPHLLMGMVGAPVPPPMLPPGGLPPPPPGLFGGLRLSSGLLFNQPPVPAPEAPVAFAAEPTATVGSSGAVFGAAASEIITAADDIVSAMQLGGSEADAVAAAVGEKRARSAEVPVESEPQTSMARAE